jgi:isopentenyl diphosphate isomerase/L-lactate dehydrogenase-like FMN-dependent dehydrogenase
MNEFASLAVRQLTRDARRLPAQVRAGGLTQQRLARLHNIADVREGARRALPRAVFDFVDGAANDELAAGRNRADFESLAIHPRYLVDVSAVDTATTLLGTPVSTPILGAPTGLSGMIHHSGEVGLARAVHGAGSVYVLSTMASYSIEEVATAAPGPKWFQLYVWKDRGFVVDLLRRARDAGYRALVVTVDGPRTGPRERDIRNGFSVPPRITARSLLDGLGHPRWSAAFVRHSRFIIGNPPPNQDPRDVGRIMDFVARQFDAALTWADLAWIREQWNGPFLVKGILRHDDAESAVEIGADAVIVSNHGGRQLDDAPSSVSVLTAVVEAIGDRAEVYLDSGVRRGSDVVKAIALGARACLVGRPIVYGLAVAGEPGARHAFDLLAREFEMTLALSGCQSVADIPTTALLGPASGSSPWARSN